MELRQLRTFVAVAELRHFARAASLCNLSQPAVSHQIAILEEEIGAKLLNRAARRVSLTVAGEVFLEEARRILGAVDRAHERMEEVARGAVGRGYFASWNRGEGTQPSLPSSSLTFHQICCFSPVG